MKVIHHVLQIEASPERVWSALTEPADMARWWSTRVSSPPAALGAEVLWTFEEGFNPVMRITTIEPPNELVWCCTRGHPPWLDNTFRFELDAVNDDQSRLRFWQEYAVELDDDSYGQYNFNWTYYLGSLRQLCETGTGRPYEAGGPTPAGG
jgi:uncharacterized protein YndB with AHSA1/START domain